MEVLYIKAVCHSHKRNHLKSEKHNYENVSSISQTEIVKKVATWKQQKNFHGPFVTVTHAEWNSSIDNMREKV